MTKECVYSTIADYMERCRTDVLRLHEEMGIEVKTLRWDIEYD